MVNQRHQFNVVAQFGAALFEIEYFLDSSDDDDERDNLSFRYYYWKFESLYGMHVDSVSLVKSEGEFRMNLELNSNIFLGLP